MPKQTELIMRLVRPAHKHGGDKYETTHEGTDFAIYVPQSVSRPDKHTPVVALKVTLEVP